MNSPKNKLTKEPIIKNGPKGIVSFMDFFFLHKISMIPKNAPVKKAKYKARIILGKPNIRPNKNASFTSPNPIPLPLVIKNSIRKKAHAPRAEKRLMIKD